MFRRFALLLAASLAVLPAQAQTFKNLAHQPPDGAVVTFQMTDGTVVAQGFNYSDWWKLTPDNKGSYQNGTWTRIADLPSDYAPYAQAESVLADGRLLISGGEYNFGVFSFTNLGAIYDPLTNKWTDLPPPKGWTNIGDSPGSVLADGRYLLGYKFKTKMAVWDPATAKWTAVPSKHKQGWHAEEGWVLLPDGSLLTVDIKAHPGSERYLVDKGKWVSAGDTQVDLRGPQDCCGHCIEYGPKNKCYDPPGETGAAVRLPDGRVFATGATPEGETKAHTAVWTPPGRHDKTGHWTPGPDFPNGDQGFDTPVSILPNGHVLVEGYGGQLYEYDGTNLVKKSFNAAGGGLMPLPTGEVLVGGFAVYASPGNPDPSWAPAIGDFPSSVTRGQSYEISGTQFNGLNQGAAFGDELDTHTNYPLVRITNTATGHVFYARTHDHSSMGVATGATPVSTHFDVPSGMETGASTLVVVANGIASVPVNVTVN
ncbi:MAG TPA: kelch repeat-containing protein [Rhizomicrobium sp.]|nr:kelch repeat-containing protein [Rhizomicrobium sp.]